MGKEIVECSVGKRDFWDEIQDVMFYIDMRQGILTPFCP